MKANSSKKTILLLLLIVVAVGGWFYTNKQSSALPSNEPIVEDSADTTAPTEQPEDGNDDSVSETDTGEEQENGDETDIEQDAENGNDPTDENENEDENDENAADNNENNDENEPDEPVVEEEEEEEIEEEEVVEDEDEENEPVACICPEGFAGEGCEVAKPDVCTQEFNPVCGCDGNQYTNPCNALAAGLSSWTIGVCINDEAENCTPECNGKECGNDGCGGTCGSCEVSEVCNENGQCEGPQPQLQLNN